MPGSAQKAEVTEEVQALVDLVLPIFMKKIQTAATPPALTEEVQALTGISIGIGTGIGVSKRYMSAKAVDVLMQPVAGTNYFVKVMLQPWNQQLVGYCPDECAFFRIFKPLPHTGQEVELASYQHHGPDSSKELCYFD